MLNINHSILPRSSTLLRNRSLPDTNQIKTSLVNSLEQDRPLVLSTAIKARHLTLHQRTADYQIGLRVYPRRPVFLNDHHLELLPCHRIKCSSCTKALLLISKVDGEAMDGKVKIRIQLCHQLILLTLKATMGIIRLTLLWWMTWFQALPEKPMTLTRLSGWPRQVSSLRRRERRL